ncbi:hypothetical protein D3C75_881270 [compost metagenome]
MKHNWVAKHMNNFNRSSVVPDKRDKLLVEEYEREMGGAAFPDEYGHSEEEDDYIPE